MEENEMYPEIHKLNTDTNGEKCYVHARGLIMPDGFGILTTQKLDLSGWDVFYGMEIMKTFDSGKIFSKPEICKNLLRRTIPNKTDVKFISKKEQVINTTCPFTIIAICDNLPHTFLILLLQY